MNILLNFYPVQSGGGQQVASNFLKVISQNNYSHSWYVFVGEGSELYKLAKEVLNEDKILSNKYSYLNRLTIKSILERFVVVNKIDIIYNYAPVLPIDNIPQVVRSVYSNLYFPEIDFWKGNSSLKKLKKRLIDKYRLNNTLKADGLIFENESMLDRAINLFNYPKSKTIYIRPSISRFDESKTNEKYAEALDTSFYKILYLSSWYLNKNIHILPQVAQILKLNNIQVVFILTIERANNDIQKKLIEPINTLNVEEYFKFVGKVSFEYVHQIVKLSDAMILLSKLECFSSNIIEAFNFKKPLIISDEPWSKAACAEGALYVERDNPNQIAESIISLVNSKELSEKLVSESQKELAKFNTPDLKVKEQVAFLEYIFKGTK